MKFLAQAIKEITAPKLSLIDVLRENLSQPMKPRSWATIHASDLTKDEFCPRAVALVEKLGKKRPDEYVDMARQSTFDVGNATSDLVRERWLRERAVGNWQCLRCDKESLFSPKPPVDDGDDHFHNWRYEEVRFWSPSHQFSGSLDVLADLDAPKLTIVEVKIIDKDQFGKLACPMPEHRIRTNLYMWLVENSDHILRSRIDTKEARVLYVSRGFGKKNEDENGQIMPFKEYTVSRDDEGLVQPLARGEAIRSWREGGIMPARECAMSFCPKAKSCPVMAPCFSS